MNLPAFLYRRFARWITCEFKASEKITLQMYDKYQVASFQDVFCNPFYWQLSEHLTLPPQVVVDCGAHCGHFSILTELCASSRHPGVLPRYWLIEPNHALHASIAKNLAAANLSDRATIINGMVGGKAAATTLFVNRKNYLTASATPGASGEAMAVASRYLDLEELLPLEKIDILKLDIEGSELEFLKQYPALLARTQILLLEWHREHSQQKERMKKAVSAAGLTLGPPFLTPAGHELFFAHR